STPVKGFGATPMMLKSMPLTRMVRFRTKGSASELGAPEIVGQDHNGVAPRDLPLVWQEASGEHGSNAYHLVEVVAVYHAVGELRILSCRFRYVKGGVL